jgi:hypothetical protein
VQRIRIGSLTSSRKTGSLLAISTALLLLGCSENTVIHTNPEGAKVYINGEFIGVSPVKYEIPDSQLPSVFRYRLEHQGYVSQEGEFHTKVSGGRVTGTIFTLGILGLFKSPSALDNEYRFALEPIESTSSSAPTQSDAAKRKLEELKQLRDRGILTEDEYQRKRADVIKGL